MGIEPMSMTFHTLPLKNLEISRTILGTITIKMQNNIKQLLWGPVAIVTEAKD